MDIQSIDSAKKLGEKAKAHVAAERRSLEKAEEAVLAACRAGSIGEMLLQGKIQPSASLSAQAIAAVLLHPSCADPQILARAAQTFPIACGEHFGADLSCKLFENAIAEGRRSHEELLALAAFLRACASWKPSHRTLLRAAASGTEFAAGVLAYSEAPERLLGRALADAIDSGKGRAPSIAHALRLAARANAFGPGSDPFFGDLAKKACHALAFDDQPALLAEALALFPPSLLSKSDQPAFSKELEKRPLEERAESDVKRAVSETWRCFISGDGLTLFEKTLRMRRFECAAALRGAGHARLSLIYRAKTVHNPQALRLALSYGHQVQGSLDAFPKEIEGSLDHAELLRAFHEPAAGTAKPKISKFQALWAEPADPATHAVLAILQDAASDISRIPARDPDYDSKVRSAAAAAVGQAQSACCLLAEKLGSDPAMARKQLAGFAGDRRFAPVFSALPSGARAALDLMFEKCALNQAAACANSQPKNKPSL